MNRRNFIQTVGGGTVAALLPGCSADYPASAVAAWNGPSDAGDVRRWALGHAILAPNSHNRQPWLVDLREPDAITLYVDRERMLPETDPWFRQIVVSQGTFVELLEMALRERGIEPRVELFPQGEFAPRQVDARPVARLSWPAGATGAAKDPLYAQILRRCTAKVDYDTRRAVAPAVLRALADAMRPDDGFGVRFGGTVDTARIEPLRTLCWDAARAELTTPRTVMESLRLTRVGPAEIAAHPDGITLNEPLVRLIDAVGLFDRRKPPEAGSAAYKNMMARFEGHSRTAMGFVWLGTATAANAPAGRTRSAELAAGRAYVRLQLQATALGLQMHPMSQAPQEFAEMRPHYERLHALTVQRPAAVGEVLARDGFGGLGVNAVAKQAGVDKVLIYRYFGGMPELLKAWGESGRFWPGIDELLGADPQAFIRLPLAERYARFFEHFIDGLRARPLTLEIMAAELVERNELTAILETEREEWGEKAGPLLGGDEWTTRPALRGITLLLVGGVQYLLVRSRKIRVFGGLDIRSDRDWDALKGAVRELARSMLAPETAVGSPAPATSRRTRAR